ncbi:MAG: YkgJ family cysteine cluster protein [Desulfobacterales bacterium]|nr:MAG: YkgJ family cysteine cluster protein [Desulfobacterales bacterium]UCD89418.1 MAG: YkgJ family cysteine cluster protein [Desulfobacterales bacterium]
MEIDFTPFFKKYEAIRDLADDAFSRVQNEFPDRVKCQIKCADCCHALFDLTLIEAIYINHRFKQGFQGEERVVLLERSNRADRKIHMIKKKAYNDKKSGKNDVEILMNLASERARCALLNDGDLCDLYEYRPITCRLYGIPTSVEGISHTCGLSDFAAGQKYPTVNLDIIQNKLYEISAEFVDQIKTRYIKMAEMLIPVSMAILTDYDEDYLGIKNPDEAEEKQG